MEKLTEDDKRKMDAAQTRRERKYKKALETLSFEEIKPTGTDKALLFTRISKGRKKKWARQYMMHRKSGTIVKVEVKE